MSRYAKLEPPSVFVLHEITYDEMKLDRGREVLKKGWIAEHKTRPEVHSPEMSRRATAIEWAWKWMRQQQASQRQEQKERREARKRSVRDGAVAGAP